MSAFYETELNDGSKDTDLETSRHFDEEDSLAKNVATHRGTKKPQKDKAKEKLWESIVNQAEQEDGDSSSDGEQV